MRICDTLSFPSYWDEILRHKSPQSAVLFEPRAFILLPLFPDMCIGKWLAAIS